MDCIFCKIVSNQVSSAKVYEDKDYLAFLDIGPLNKGHTLVMTKRHYDTFLDMPKKELSSINIVCKDIANAIIKVTNAQGFNLFVNTNPVAGQTVNHVHFHIVPRFENDKHSWKSFIKGSYKDGEAVSIASKIKSLL